MLHVILHAANAAQLRSVTHASRVAVTHEHVKVLVLAVVGSIVRVMRPDVGVKTADIVSVRPVPHFGLLSVHWRGAQPSVRRAIRCKPIKTGVTGDTYDLSFAVFDTYRHSYSYRLLLSIETCHTCHLSLRGGPRLDVPSSRCRSLRLPSVHGHRLLDRTAAVDGKRARRQLLEHIGGRDPHRVRGHQIVVT
jgi:hypothetical protein